MTEQSKIAIEDEEFAKLRESIAKADSESPGASGWELGDGYRPELPDCGVYVHWPTEDDWFHPDDTQVVKQLLPSLRVWHRTEWDGEYYLLRYGNHRLRVRPTMWLRLPKLDVEIGDRVEVLAKEGANEPGIYSVAEMLFDRRFQQINYRLSMRGMVLSKPFQRSDYRLLNPRTILRSGFYEHAPPKARLPKDLKRLDVGELT